MNYLRPSALSSPRRPRPRPPRSRWIGVAVLVSLLLHLGAFGLFAVASRHAARTPPAEGTVELLMVEKKGDQANEGGPQPTPPRPKTSPPVQPPSVKPLPAKPVDATPPKPAEQPAPPPAVATPKGDEPAPPVAPPPPEPARQPPQEAPPEPAQETPPKPEPTPPQPEPTPPQPPRKEAEKPAPPVPPVQPTPPTPEQAPVFDFSGTDSESNAEVLGGKDILPASPDDRYRNRPPPYPNDAARRGEHGAVLVMIHVGADGMATGAELIESSGYPSLDRAALAAVRTWHFHPALRDSQPVPFDMPFRFDFQAN